MFPSLTVMENLELGSYRRAARAGRAQALAAVLALFPILHQRRTQLAGSLSGGEQQMLALGRGLMAQPDLLLLDEPSQDLGPRIVELIFETIDRTRRERRLTILLVEQRVVEALELCDRGYVLETGRVVLAGPATRCWPTRACSARTSARSSFRPASGRAQRLPAQPPARATATRAVTHSRCSTPPSTRNTKTSPTLSVAPHTAQRGSSGVVMEPLLSAGAHHRFG